MTEMASESVIISGLHLLVSPKLPPKIIGRSESTHGAKIVRNPAKKEANSKVINRIYKDLLIASLRALLFGAHNWLTASPFLLRMTIKD